MKLLHTSDWHVGKTLRGRSRAEEHEAVLAEMAVVAAEEQVDLVVVAGDLFDTAAPTPESERIVYRALLDLAATGATVVLVAGNHDNERRLAAVVPLLSLGRIVARPTFAPAGEGGVVEVKTAAGELCRVALLPFLSQRYVVRAEELMAGHADEHALRYAERVRRIVGSLTAGFTADTVNLVVAHLMVEGGSAGGGERAAHTVMDYWVSSAAFPASAHYVALGHLHRTQRIAGPSPIWYSGSPLQLDFGETDDQKCVVVVEAEVGAPATVRPVPLRAGRRLRTLRGTLADLAPISGATGLDYLRVHVQEPVRPGLADEVRELFPEVVDVVVEVPERLAPAAARAERAGRAPRDLFAEYLSERRASDERLLDLFDELLEEAHAPDPA